MTVLPHEAPEAHSLEQMPITVQRKLVESGVALDQASWQRLPRVARQRLVDVRVDTAVERRTFRHLVEWLAETFLQAPVASSEKVSATTFPWRDPTPPAGVEVCADEWGSLGIDARYALVLCRDPRDRARILSAHRAIER